MRAWKGHKPPSGHYGLSGGESRSMNAPGPAIHRGPGPEQQYNGLPCLHDAGPAHPIPGPAMQHDGSFPQHPGPGLHPPHWQPCPSKPEGPGSTAWPRLLPPAPPAGAMNPAYVPQGPAYCAQWPGRGMQKPPYVPAGLSRAAKGPPYAARGLHRGAGNNPRGQHRPAYYERPRGRGGYRQRYHSRSPRPPRTRSRSPYSSVSSSGSSRSWSSSSSRSRSRDRARRCRSRSRSSSSSSRRRSKPSRSPSPPASHGSKPPPPPHKDSRKPSKPAAVLREKFFGVQIMNFPPSFSDKFIWRRVVRKFEKFGKVISTSVRCAGRDRCAVVVYESQAEQEKALQADGEQMLGRAMSVFVFKGSQSQRAAAKQHPKKARPPAHPVEKKGRSSPRPSHNTHRPQSRSTVKKDTLTMGPLDENDNSPSEVSRLLFVSNLDVSISKQDLFNAFGRFGEIIDIYINSLPTTDRQFAFLQFTNSASVTSAIRVMSGMFLGKCQVTLSYGVNQPSKCVCVEGLSSALTNEYLIQRFSEHGTVEKVLYNRERGAALISYVDEKAAKRAVKATRTLKITGESIMMDYANDSFQLHFCQSIIATEQGTKAFRHM